MVNKITKNRLKNVLVYDGLKIIVLSVIVCIIAVLIFNAIAKKPSDGQDFRMIVDDALYTEDDEMKFFFDELFENGVENGGFSYETLQGQTMILRSSDESPKNYVLNSVYAELAQDDVCVLEQDIYLQYVSQRNAIDILNYLDSAIEFLIREGLCDVNGTFDKNAVDLYFDRTRGGDTRFKTQEQIENGKADELKRLTAIYKNATALKRCFEAHPELLDTRTYSVGEIEITGKFAIIISNFDGNNGRYVENLFKRSYKNESGETVYTTEGIFLALGDNLNTNGDVFYENLAFLYTLINTYSTYLSI